MLPNRVLCLRGDVLRAHLSRHCIYREKHRADMIKLTRLDGEAFILNADLIRYVEARPDTFVTLTNGDRLVVRESMDDVLDRAVRYQQTKHLVPELPGRSVTACT